MSITVYDEDLDDLRAVLPCTTRKEIAHKLTKRQRRSVPVWFVDVLLRILHRHADEYGWTTPPVKKGVPTEADIGRFFVVTVATGKRPGLFDVAEQRQVNGGTVSFAAHIATMTATLAKKLEVALPHVQASSRDPFDEIHKDLEFVARKAARALAEFRRTA